MFLFLSVREPRSPIGPRSASASAWIQVTPLAQLSLLSIAFAFFLPFHPLAWVPHHLHNYHSSLPYPVLILTHRARSQFGAFKESICSALEQSSRAVEDAKISMDELADQAELIVQVIITYIVPPSCSSFLSPFSSSFLSCPLPCLALPLHHLLYTHTLFLSSSIASILLFDCATRNWKKWRVEGSLSRHSNCASSAAPSCSAATSTSTSSLALTASVLRASHSRLKTCCWETQRSWSTRTPALHCTDDSPSALLEYSVWCVPFNIFLHWFNLFGRCIFTGLWGRWRLGSGHWHLAPDRYIIPHPHPMRLTFLTRQP